MVIEWIQQHGLVLGFYILVGLLIILNRKKFEFQGIIAIYKTKLGINAMKKFATPLNQKKDLIGKKLFTYSTIIFTASTIAYLINLIIKIQHTTFNVIISFLLITGFLGICAAIIFLRQIKPAGKLGIIIGFIGMGLMIVLMIVGLYQLFFVPTAPPMFSPVLPGIGIPGSPKLPLFEGLIALFIVVVIHEFSHGVVSKAHKIPIKSSGFVMLGPIPGAFVEPDEKKLKKANTNAQLSIYAAGPFSNILLAGFIMILMIPITLLTLNLYEPTGIQIQGLVNNETQEERGLTELEIGSTINKLNNESINSYTDFVTTLRELKPGDEINLTTTKNQETKITTITLNQHPEDEEKPYIGVFLANEIQGTNKISQNKAFTKTYFWLFGNPYIINTGINLKTVGLMNLIFILSFGIGIVNLLPIAMLDGGRMVFLLVKQKHGEKKTVKILSMITKILVFLILILILIPIIRIII